MQESKKKKIPPALFSVPVMSSRLIDHLFLLLSPKLTPANSTAKFGYLNPASTFGTFSLYYLFFHFHPPPTLGISTSPRPCGHPVKLRVGPEMRSLLPLTVYCISLVSLQQLLALPAEERPDTSR